MSTRQSGNTKHTEHLVENGFNVESNERIGFTVNIILGPTPLTSNTLFFFETVFLVLSGELNGSLAMRKLTGVDREEGLSQQVSALLELNLPIP